MSNDLTPLSFIEALEELNPFAYGGRGMGNRRCVAVTVAGIFRGLANVVRGLDEFDIETADIADLIEGTRSDAMGRDVVLYWPDMPWPDKALAPLTDNQGTKE